MADQEEEYRQEAYYIPSNFKDAGGVLGGKLGKRNAIELFVICAPIAMIEYKILFPLIHNMEAKIIIAMVTLLPLVFLCAFGIGGESLSQIALAYYRFRKGRRTLHYRNFTNPDDVSAISATSKLDKFMSDANSEGFAAAMKNMSADSAKVKEAGKKAAEKEEADSRTARDTRKGDKRADLKSDVNKKHERGGTSKTGYNEASKHQESKAHRGSKNSKPTRSRQSGLISSATKEMILRKLELGDDDDYY